jgi:hypothetical protein
MTFADSSGSHDTGRYRKALVGRLLATSLTYLKPYSVILIWKYSTLYAADRSSPPESIFEKV